MLLISLHITIQTHFFGIHKVFSAYLTEHRDRFEVYDSIHNIDYDQLLSIKHSSLHSFTHLVCYYTWGHRQEHDTVPDLKKPQPFAGNDIITSVLEVLIICEPNVEEIWR